MEIFYSEHIDPPVIQLGREESTHCCRVLRHRRGDVVQVIDGEGTMYDAELTDDDPAGTEARIVGEHPGWGVHGYHLTLAVCPTKNADRYEWFAEKATELGVDVIQPLIGERSERRTLKTDRLRKVVLSAAKQSLKSLVPKVMEPLSVQGFLSSRPNSEGGREGAGLRLIACCFDGERERVSVKDALSAYAGSDVTVLIGPEGDFSPEEASMAAKAGFIPIHLGASRLRTETAAVYAAAEVYSKYL